MIPLAGSSVAGAGATFASAFSNMFNNWLNVRYQQDANAQNIALAGRANQWSIDQWNRENAYNNPRAQMMRLKMAGINPNAAFANGVDGNLAGASPAVTTPSVAAPYTQSVYDPLVASQVALNEAQARKLNTDADDVEQTRGVRLELLQSTLDNSRKDLDVKVQDIAESISREKLNKQQIVESVSRVENDNKRLSIEERVQQTDEFYKSALISNLHEKNLTERKQRELVDVQINHAHAAIKKLAAETKLLEREFTEKLETYMLRVSKLISESDEIDSRKRLNNAIARLHEESRNSTDAVYARIVGAAMQEFHDESVDDILVGFLNPLPNSEKTALFGWISTGIGGILGQIFSVGIRK